MTHSTFLRDEGKANEMVDQLRASVGMVSRYGRIVSTLLGAELKVLDRGGRALYLVKPIVHVHDPLFDGNLSREVLAARQSFAARST